MRKLTEKESNEMKRRCFRLERNAALLEGGRYLCELGVLHWTSTDVEKVIFKSSRK